VGIKEGDFLEVEPAGQGIFLRPKTIVDWGEAVAAFTRAFEKLQASASDTIKDMDEDELAALIAEAIKAAREPKRVKQAKALPG
jgi:bifunctional DNA-binding transcriptional regulator/antitoxin component of YhaV-PrlF toxin-antitoxin module